MCNRQSKTRPHNPSDYVPNTLKERQLQAQKDSLQLRIDPDELKKLHHTADYKCTTEFLPRDYLVVRRGLPLKFSIDSRNTDLSKMQLSEAWLCISEEESLPLEVKVETSSKFLLKAHTFLSTDTPVGLYEKLTAKLSPVKEDSELEEVLLSTRMSVFVAFNPWSKEELVYMEDEAERAEYVNNDRGVIWTGNILPRPWFFAQHQEVVLAALSRALREEEATREQLADPLHVSRILSKHLVERILVGKWTGDYSHGKDPSCWKGTGQILSEYLASSEAVRYGQCWAFSGVLCSLLRGVGIPSRPVTNYNSAHEITSRAEGVDLQVDFFLDQNGNPIPEKNKDFLWNFHTWTELWLNRSDLVSLSDEMKVSPVGWQAIDATPQETDTGVIGPASVSAIKQGCVDIPFNTAYLYGEVNADHVYHMKMLDGSFKEVFRDTGLVGRDISTKSVGRVDRSDVTGLYKYPEGRREEREGYKKAHNKSIAQELAVVSQKVNIEFSTPNVVVGQEFVGRIEVANTSPQLFQAMVLGKAYLLHHNGKIIKKIFEAKHPWKKFHARDTVVMDFSLAAKDYLEHLKEQAFILAYAYVQLKETNQKLLRDSKAHFIIPSPKVTVPDTVRAYEPFNLSFSFANPLKTALHEVEILGHAIKGVTQGFELVVGELPVDESVSEIHYLKFFQEGRHKMVITAYCQELPPVSCIADLSVVPAVGQS